MHLFLDESGNTGLDLLDQDQPLFALASTNLKSEQCQALIAPLLRQNQSEAKYARLKGNKPGQQALLKFFSSAQLDPLAAKFYMADKRYYLITHLIDKLIEPPLHEAGIDLYAGDGHVGLVNVWYYAGHTIFPDVWWEKVLRAFLHAIRERTKASYTNFDAVLTDAMSTAPKDSRDYATGLFLARGRLAEFIGVYTDIEVFDPAVDVFIALINKWMAADSNLLDVTHDRSKPLRRNEAFLRVMMTPVAARVVGYGDRQAELPLRISTLDFADSTLHPQLQVADLVAGASIDCLLAWSGRRPRTNYHHAMRETRLNDLFVGGMLPSPKIERTNAPRAGQKNLVDGATEFLSQVGYFANTKAPPK